MKVLVKRTAEYEIVTTDEGLACDGFLYPDIEGVLEDETADKYEITRTIVELFNFPYSSTVRDRYEVFAFDDQGRLFFTGSMDDNLYV